jgi:hypothetical protein
VIGAGVVIVVGLGGYLYVNHLTTWKCFKVDEMLNPTPHTEKDDEYCVAYKGSGNNRKWYLVPGTGMENWKGIGGDNRIRLTVTTNDDENKVFEFDLRVTDHDQLPPSDHDHEHKKPKYGYELTVTDPSNLPAEAEFAVQGSSSIHAGTAHSNEN